MFNNEIMPPYEKIRKYRVITGATQDEIADGVCTKIWLSKIENNKKKLKFNLATGIAENFNKIINEKGLSVPLITPDELMEDEDDQANHIFANIVSELKEIRIIDTFEQKFCEAEDLIEKYNITDNNKIELYKLATDFYYYKNRYSKSDYLCDIGLKISVNSQNSFEEVTFFIYKSRNNIFLDLYIKALQQLDYAEKLNDDIVNDELSIMILYYKALAYKKLGEYDSALECFKVLKKFEIKNWNMLLKKKINHANCLNDYHKFEDAEKVYKEALSIAMKYDNNDYIAMTYRNLSELYTNKKNYKSATMYIKECLSCNPNYEDRGEYLYFASKVLQHSNEDVKYYLLQALEVCEKNDNENGSLIEQVIYELVLIYIQKEDKQNLLLIADKAKELNIDYSLIYSEIGAYYRGRNDEKSIYFYEKSRERMKQIKGI
ncbi:tetratricopeptide repeat protein [Clostridium cibarium]|uniref:Tetratricopeptide repeat protein n=1 Tax=Clostridium cibarium TaxID=2762247 RepID=A0ABR8PZC5_9CLOT|nr:tetratricopeptide repeat protein [Clostridium cibarium]MBD7913506.1 tetratricopeptide repeat protein [Clostridium cibarium]